MAKWRKRKGKWEKAAWGTRPLGPSMRAYLKSIGAAVPFFLVPLWRAWPKVVGEHVAELAQPMGRRKNTLLIGVEDSAVLQELTYYAPQILEDVNGFLGKEIFDKVKVDLIMGKAPLEMGLEEPASLHAPRTSRPDGLSGEAGLTPDSPVGRCYRAYVRLFEGR